jgi:hypothetical protein
MVITKISAGTVEEREVEIVNEKGTWESGNYHLFAAHFLKGKGQQLPEPHNINSPEFLGEVNIDKEKGSWQYNGDQLNADEQKQIATFILDYNAPDGVY